MLRHFLSQHTFNFKESGVELPKVDGTSFHIQMDFGFFVVDERARKLGFDFKGASGAKCCAYCLNVLGAQSYPGDSEYLVRFTEPRRVRWHMHTTDTFREVRDRVDAAKGISA